MAMTLEELVELLGAGAAGSDEPGLSALSHHLQCVRLLARDHPDDPELQAAGLVHDVGSTAEPGRPAEHAATGGALVRDLLGARVARLVAGHADAKRYLVTTDPGYRDCLSPTSVVTLATQGGTMSEAEVAAWSADPDRAALVALRRADDAAKVLGLEVPGLDEWRPLLESLRR